MGKRRVKPRGATVVANNDERRSVAPSAMAFSAADKKVQT